MSLSRSEIINQITKLEEKLNQVHTQKHLIEQELQNLEHKLKSINEEKPRKLCMPTLKRNVI